MFKKLHLLIFIYISFSLKFKLACWIDLGFQPSTHGIKLFRLYNERKNVCITVKNRFNYELGNGFAQKTSFKI